jgi:hypothetical protein
MGDEKFAVLVSQFISFRTQRREKQEHFLKKNEIYEVTYSAMWCEHAEALPFDYVLVRTTFLGVVFENEAAEFLG